FRRERGSLLVLGDADHPGAAGAADVVGGGVRVRAAAAAAEATRASCARAGEITAAAKVAVATTPGHCSGPRGTHRVLARATGRLHEARRRARRHGPARAARLVRHCRAESHVEPARAAVGIALEVWRGAERRRAAGAAAGAVAACARSTDR